MTDDDQQPAPWELIARHLAAEATSVESEELERWLAEDPSRRDLVNGLRAALDRAGFTPAVESPTPPTDLDVEAALARVHERMDAEAVRPITTAPSRRARRPLWQLTPLRAAAAVVLALAAAGVYRALSSGSRGGTGPLAERTYQTPVGQADTVRLADGTTVVLAPASRLEVAAGYGEASRQVRLEGVAWFDVAHDARRTFSVRAGDAVVTDLGTTFTVRADPAQAVSVAVTTGSVRLAFNGSPTSGVTINAGERGLVTGGVAAAAGQADTATALGWTRGRMVFADAPFSQLASELHRWYGVQLVAGDSALAARHLTSEFENEALTDVIAVIGLALDARAELRGDTIVLHSQQ